MKRLIFNLHSLSITYELTPTTILPRFHAHFLSINCTVTAARHWIKLDNLKPKSCPYPLCHPPFLAAYQTSAKTLRWTSCSRCCQCKCWRWRTRRLSCCLAVRLVSVAAWPEEVRRLLPRRRASGFTLLARRSASRCKWGGQPSKIQIIGQCRLGLTLVSRPPRSTRRGRNRQPPLHVRFVDLCNVE